MNVQLVMERLGGGRTWNRGRSAGLRMYLEDATQKTKDVLDTMFREKEIFNDESNFNRRCKESW